MKKQIVNVLKKFWFVILVGCVLIGGSVYFAYDTNKNRIPGKRSEGKDVIFSLNDENYTADEYYDSLFNTDSNGTKEGIAIIYNLLQKDVLDQCVDTTDDMKETASTNVETYASYYEQLYGDSYEDYIGNQLILAGYDGYDDFEEFFIDQEKEDQLVTDYIKDNPELFDKVYKNESPRVISHILVSCEDPDNPTKEEKAKMKEVEEALAEDGATFAKVAKKYSDDTGSASDGGSLGICLKSDSLVTEFKTAAWKLKSGETSDWVKTDYGYHLIHIVTTKKSDMLKDKYADSLRSILENEDSYLLQKVVWAKANELGLEISDDTTKEELMEYCGVSEDSDE